MSLKERLSASKQQVITFQLRSNNGQRPSGLLETTTISGYKYLPEFFIQLFFYSFPDPSTSSQRLQFQDLLANARSIKMRSFNPQASVRRAFYRAL